MQGRGRRAAATGAAAFLLAGSAILATPGTASAETIQARCGDTVTAKPGDRIETPFGLRTVTDGLTSLVGGLLSGVCKITVNVVDTVVEPVPVVGKPAAGAVNDVVEGTTKSVTDTTNKVAGAVGGNEPAPQSPGTGGEPAPRPGPGTGPGPAAEPSGRGSDGGRGAGMPAPNSPVLGGSALPGFAYLPTSFGTGFAPMRDYSGIPMASAGLFAPSPGVRYGGQIPGYSPEFGILGESGENGTDERSGVQNAGRAEALPAGSGGNAAGATLPMLLAVLALSGVTAALVRTWVLRQAKATA
ncbi:hypothetical protein [Qaidamihabitans albus]|uniref:hypothetical protein n=1 Tax=Qaidamihabitans albus TaxID=2795733 RepID=UPI0018F13936|nr:hypothetical protein [Qaidamihabitans albus]